MFLKALWSVFCEGGFVKRLTSGITTNGTSMARDAAKGEFLGPTIKKRDMFTVSPVIIEAKTPAVMRFQ